MINLKISKLIKPEKIKGELIAHRKLSHLNGIQTGDTTGQVLIAIGAVMRDGKASIGSTTGKETERKFHLIKYLIGKLGLLHIKVERIDTVTIVLIYDIYMTEGELFRSIS